VALMDVILIELAVAEMLSFKEIPIRVTLNEYIELSKYYSTDKSHIFINGILEKIVRHLVEKKQITPAQLQ
jgi:N utilization substance protein B